MGIHFYFHNLLANDWGARPIHKCVCDGERNRDRKKINHKPCNFHSLWRTRLCVWERAPENILYSNYDSFRFRDKNICIIHSHPDKFIRHVAVPMPLLTPFVRVLCGFDIRQRNARKILQKWCDIIQHACQQNTLNLEGEKCVLGENSYLSLFQPFHHSLFRFAEHFINLLVSSRSDAAEKYCRRTTII